MTLFLVSCSPLWSLSALSYFAFFFPEIAWFEYCCTPLCTSQQVKCLGLSLHHFWRDEPYRSQWMAAIRHNKGRLFNVNANSNLWRRTHSFLGKRIFCQKKNRLKALSFEEGHSSITKFLPFRLLLPLLVLHYCSAVKVLSYNIKSNAAFMLSLRDA